MDMIEKTVLDIPCPAYEKRATVYAVPGPVRAAVLYLHGGALLYGDRDDLPPGHIRRLCDAGFAVVTLDYPLAPAAAVEDILADVGASVGWYLGGRQALFGGQIPYFLWGRSAGAYLALMQLKRGLPEPPAGVLSYYGYGYLAGDWAAAPSAYYARYPRVSPVCLRVLSPTVQTSAPLQSHFAAYVYLRQTGQMSRYIRGGGGTMGNSLRDFFPNGDTPPVFFAHAESDPDVPFREFQELVRRFAGCGRFTAPLSVHDFDSDEASPVTAALLEESVRFLDRCLEK